MSFYRAAVIVRDVREKLGSPETGPPDLGIFTTSFCIYLNSEDLIKSIVTLE